MMRRSSIKINTCLFFPISALALFLFVGCGLNGNKGAFSQSSPQSATSSSSRTAPTAVPSTTAPTAVPSTTAPTAVPSTTAPTAVPSSLPGKSSPPPRSSAILCGLQTPPGFLNFSLDPGGDPDPQTIKFTNCGGSGSWSSSVTTDDRGSWLSIDPPEGMLDSGASQSVLVKVVSKNLAIKDYNGHIAITLGSNTKHLNPKLYPFTLFNGCIGASCPSLNPSSTLSVPSGQKTQQPLADMSAVATKYSWSATASTIDGAAWLSISPGMGTFPLATGASPLIMVDATNLQPKTYTGSIVFTIGPNANTYTYPVTLYVTAPSSSPIVQPTQTPASEPTQTPTS